MIKKLLNFLKMTGVSRDAPIGIQCLQKFNLSLCPRWQVNKLRCYQASVLMLTYFTYMTYHLTRKPISVLKSVLHQNCSALPPPDWTPTNDEWCNWPPFNTSDANTLLGALDSAFLFSYAGAMFVSGMIAERVDLRYFLSLGMLVSAFMCYLFGLARTLSIHHISYYLLVQAGAGIAQTTGWPGTVSVVGKWFGDTKKGLIFGIWNSHTSLGNILGTVMAAEYVEGDWSQSFFYPALVMGAVGFLVFLFLAPEPSQKHYQFVVQQPSRQSRRSTDEEEPSQVIVGDQYEDESVSEHTSLLPPRGPAPASPSPVSLARALRIPGVIEFSMSLFFAKLVSYTFLYWLPLYIKSSSELSTAFDVGGVAGAIVAGLLADAVGVPAIVCVVFYALCAPTVLTPVSVATPGHWRRSPQS
ncbi:unnamed protein product [Leptidea sinapis]|uniref:Sugar phosphate exchanger 3 n=1 Tax=Leptidea sinapis TaxID=189913 RepID=A0A5E4QQF9_9NEOP|nr:unnamed protein product [Leptidea sinapis]